MNYGRYQILKELGRGTMGVVYQAHDPNIERMVALKVLRQDRVLSEDFVRRFLKEAKAIGRLSHPNIVTVFDVGQDRNTIYIAMEYLEGKPLNEIIKESSIGVDQIVELGIQAAETLDHAHKKGIIHRDIKPSNIIITPDGQVKLTDFGIAHIEDQSAAQQTQAGEILGTPVYMSPEQVMSRPVDGRSDLYSLGVILYEIAVGDRPFKGDNLAAIFHSITQDTPAEPCLLNASIPKALSDLILKGIAKAPEERFQSGMEMAGALRSCTAAGRKDTLPQESIPVKKKRTGLFVLSGFIAVFVSAVIAYFSGAGRLKHEDILSALKVASVPEGAQVFVDNSFKGKTPISVKLPFGKYEVKLSLSEYHDWEAQIRIDKEGEIPLNVRMFPIEDATP
ncbi:putative Mitogen-activated protein kinase kinase kinase [uncultured Desulfobacterium sp.]|uniref:non-specific serine/threonine protein kinase n=1 Tax=uncultured Desulfobacterium sp. TaxID=201089 RepID=A0A445MUD5_9BACT|nr:putative Mitogen-activated protein kinase kinase kinase [uncultured Desulfobacterium sp.]